MTKMKTLRQLARRHGEAAVLTAALIMSAAPLAFAKDGASQTFLKKAIEGNYAEIGMGDLAQKNGQSEAVKSYGKMLVDDHTAANRQATAAATAMGMTPPDGPSEKEKAEAARMTKMSGAKFDKMFAKAMVKDHTKDIAEYKKESKMSDQAGQYAAAQIPTLQKHLDAAKQLETAPQ